MAKSSVGAALDTGLLTRVMGFAKPYMKVFYFTLFLTIALAALGVARPILIGQAVDVYVINSDPQGLLRLMLIVAGLLFLEAVAEFYNTYYSNWLGQSVTIDLRNRLFDHIVSFKLKYFDRTAIGTLVTRCVSDIETIAQIFSQGLLNIFGELLKLIVVVTVMFVINWQLALYALLPIPLLILSMVIFKNAIKKAFQQVRT